MSLEVVSDPHEVVPAFRRTGALLTGNFRVTSGLHTPVFFQKALLFADPPETARLCAILAEQAVLAYGWPDVVVSVATGGIIPGYEVARALGVRALYLEREQGALHLRRGFRLDVGDRVLLVDDVVSTGLSLGEAAAALRGHASGPVLLGAYCLVDRRPWGSAEPEGLRVGALARVVVPYYQPDAVPPEVAALPVLEPGSRRLR